ncbi:MAG: dipeptidase [Acutalibacteraceae bacterium]
MNYFDLHCDTPYECYFKKQEFLKNSLAVSGEKGAAFEKWSQVFAVWIRDDQDEPYKLYKAILKDFKEKLSKKPDNLIPYFSVEGGAVIEDDIDRLYDLNGDGVRILTLTWNGENRIAGGSKTDKGLTHFGKRVIREMNDLNMLCDLSHLNEKSFYSAVELADFPLATHSNCKTVFDCPRNLSDSQLKLIAEKGGIVGLCLYTEFLGGDVFDRLYQNIYHLLELGMENNIAVGSDFDGADMAAELDSIAKIPILYAKLCEKGLSETVLDKIFYKNAENYLETFDKRR